ncbi:hypothetical protein [Mycobacterium sp. ACS4331]|uniref:hypothetical protein n=1 Tax=Mycobacterium sp. ACS4331 TaxID=1834121 RepID=UPI000801E99D|nr:hypothetical protein [Mycobacterium sp. ACS4331]OBF10498.1 hypothetical protein A5727_21470 [Mycobacterium sp. ACS4331]
MGLPDWSRGKITLAMGAVAAPVALVLILTAPRDDVPSADCQRVDDAAHHLAAVFPGVLQGMGGTADPNLPRKAAEAETAIRTEAAAIQDSEVKTTVLALAEAVHRISRGSPSAPPSGFPDRDFIGGYQDSTAALHAVKLLCPNVGTDAMPADMPALPN